MGGGYASWSDYLFDRMTPDWACPPICGWLDFYLLELIVMVFVVSVWTEPSVRVLKRFLARLRRD